MLCIDEDLISSKNSPGERKQSKRTHLRLKESMNISQTP